jgi:hypothetical protein
MMSYLGNLTAAITGMPGLLLAVVPRSQEIYIEDLLHQNDL